MKVLVISDTHIVPSNPLPNLWKLLGEYCVKTKPDVIVHLGDVADLSSLSWLKAARGPYTIEQEIDCVREHLEAFSQALLDYNKTRRQMKKAIYKPRKILCLGNHDVRQDNTFIDELFTDFGWEVYPYQDIVQIDGVNFSHCMRKGLSDVMCTTAQELLENWHGNIVVGHGHHKDYAESYSLATCEQIVALKSPVFNLNEPDWAKQTFFKWSRGFTEIETSPFNFVWKDIQCLLENS